MLSSLSGDCVLVSIEVTVNDIRKSLMDLGITPTDRSIEQVILKAQEIQRELDEYKVDILTQISDDTFAMEVV